MLADDKKAWLSRYRRILDEIHSLECLERERFIGLTEPSANGIDGMPKPPQLTNRSDRMIVRHMEVREDLDSLNRKAKEIRREIMEAIGRLDDPNQAQVLRYKYINGLRLREIAVQFNYSVSGIYKLHAKGITNIVINEEDNNG